MHGWNEKWTNLLLMKNIAIRTLYILFSWDFAPNTRAKNLKSVYKVRPWNKLKGFVFSVIRLEVYTSFVTGIFLQVLYLPSTAVVEIEDLEDGFLRSFFFALSIIGNFDLVSLQISCRK